MTFRIDDLDCVLVIGAGRSGVAATRLLLKHGVRVILYDDHPREQLRYFNETDLFGHALLTTCFNRAFDKSINISAAILSPGVPRTHPLVVHAEKNHVLVINEIDLAAQFLPPHCTMIGITGTNGKSTTTVMMASICAQKSKHVIACGNLGTPLCDEILKAQAPIDYVVLELSSFQLEMLNHTKLDGAILLNITPDHLDRYDSFAEYQNAKFAIANLVKKPTGVIAVNETLRSSLPSTWNLAATTFFSPDDIRALPHNILGAHNRENALAAWALAKGLDFSLEFIEQGLRSYQPLPHRCEMVGQKNGITFINDSKGTTVVAVLRALSMSRARTHLLLGGIEKGENFAVLNQREHPQIHDYYVFGRATEKILRDLQIGAEKSYHDLQQAFFAAVRNAHPGDVILLSPGCASYDQFIDYHHRGETFKQLVTAL